MLDFGLGDVLQNSNEYNETFAPTAKLTSVRMLMQIAARHNMDVIHMDVRSAFLHADLGGFDLYVKPPEGFESYDSEGNLMVCKLNKSLYGLKQSGCNWNSLLDDFF